MPCSCVTYFIARVRCNVYAHLLLCRCDGRIWLVQEVARAAEDTLAGLRVCAARCTPAARRILHAGRHHVGLLRWHWCLPVRHRRRIAAHRCAHSRRQQAEPASQPDSTVSGRLGGRARGMCSIRTLSAMQGAEGIIWLCIRPVRRRLQYRDPATDSQITSFEYPSSTRRILVRT